MSEFKLAEAIAVLSRTPSVCAALLEGLPETWSEARERPDAWSCREIIAHLIEGERNDWIPRARSIIAHGEAVPFTPLASTGLPRRKSSKRCRHWVTPR